MTTGTKRTDPGVLVVAVTGGIASGKSSVCRMFERRGAKIIDADAMGQRVIEEPEILPELVRTFGKRILSDEGKLDRKRLGGIVFSDRASLQSLNRIVHPILIERICNEIDGLVRSGFRGVIAVDAALIFEWNLIEIFDAIVVVSSREGIQQARMRDRDSLGAREALSRIRCQIPQAEKIARADLHIENDGSTEELEKRAAGVWEKLQELLRAKGG